MPGQLTRIVKWVAPAARWAKIRDLRRVVTGAIAKALESLRKTQ